MTLPQPLPRAFWKMRGVALAVWLLGVGIFLIAGWIFFRSGRNFDPFIMLPLGLAAASCAVLARRLDRLRR